jgi:hypothetical protein
MTEWERQMALRGLPPSSSHRGWNFIDRPVERRIPPGFGIVAIIAFSAIVWLLIIFH